MLNIYSIMYIIEKRCIKRYPITIQLSQELNHVNKAQSTLEILLNAHNPF